MLIFSQVQKLGCVAFALLFDDIDPQLHGADLEAFTSFGDAQVEITNNIYKHLGCPSFLFCPTGNFPSTVNLSFVIFVCNYFTISLLVVYFAVTDISVGS